MARVIRGGSVEAKVASTEKRTLKNKNVAKSRKITEICNK